MEKSSQRKGFRGPSPAMVVACIALAVALSGVSYAASHLARNSVGTAHLKNGAVTAPKIRANAVNGSKVANNSLTVDDLGVGSVGSDEIIDATIVAGDLDTTFLASLATEADVGDLSTDPGAAILAGELEPNNTDSIVDWSKLS